MNRSRITGDLVSQNNIFVDIANDRVGIGSTIPAHKLSLPDDEKISLGDSANLQIYYDASSYITNSTAGHLFIKTINGGSDINLQSADDFFVTTGTKNSIIARDSAQVELYHNGNKKFETTSTGAIITGRLIIDGLDLGDSETIRLGDSQDLQLFHNGSHSYISDLGTGDLRITGSAVHIQNAAQSENMIKCFEGDRVELYHNNSKKFQSTAYGVNVTGTTDTDGLIAVSYTHLRAHET